MAETIFSKIIRKEIPADIVYEDEDVLAFNDINPQAPVHILVIPKIEIPTMNDMEEPHQLIIGKVMYRAAQIAKEMGLAKDGYRLVVNTNEGAGQTVFQIHCHLIGGRPLNWPPG